MELMSKFAERLDEVTFDTHLNGKELALAVGVRPTTVYNLLNGKRQPSIEVLVRFADYFKVSTDYLLGREPERAITTFKKRPPWKEQIAFLLKHYGVTKYRLCKDVPITHSIIFAWQRGSIPNLDYVLRLADYFGCSVDFVLGREK